MEHQKNYSWELKLQMAQLLETGEQNPSQISRDYHITRSLLHFWWQVYQEQGEAAFRLTQAVLSPPHVEQLQTFYNNYLGEKDIPSILLIRIITGFYPE